MDLIGVVFEVVGEFIKEYFWGCKDIIWCIVIMLIDDIGVGGGVGLGGVGESLFEEFSWGVIFFENVDSDDDVELDGDEVWVVVERYILLNILLIWESFGIFCNFMLWFVGILVVFL